MNFDRSRILDQGLRLVFPTLLLVGLFLYFRGHNSPGGGFAGGLVIGAAIVLRWAAGDPVRMRLSPVTFLGAGLVLAAITGFGSVVVGNPFLDGGSVGLTIPVIGTVKFYSVMAFDTGVMLVVIGMITLVLDHLDDDDLESS